MGGAKFHTLVCRRKPGWAIALTTACPHRIAKPNSSLRRKPESRGAGVGNVARSKTTRGEGLVPRSSRTAGYAGSIILMGIPPTTSIDVGATHESIRSN